MTNPEAYILVIIPDHQKICQLPVITYDTPETRDDGLMTIKLTVGLPPPDVRAMVFPADLSKVFGDRWVLSPKPGQEPEPEGIPVMLDEETGEQ